MKREILHVDNVAVAQRLATTDCGQNLSFKQGLMSAKSRDNTNSNSDHHQ